MTKIDKRTLAASKTAMTPTIDKCAFCGTPAERAGAMQRFGTMNGEAAACWICAGAELRKAYAALERDQAKRDRRQQLARRRRDRTIHALVQDAIGTLDNGRR